MTDREQERVKELLDELQGLDNRLIAEQAENQRYKQALEFYADENNYEFETIVSDCDIEVESKILDDGGAKARQALEGEE